MVCVSQVPACTSSVDTLNGRGQDCCFKIMTVLDASRVFERGMLQLTTQGSPCQHDKQTTWQKFETRGCKRSQRYFAVFCTHVRPSIVSQGCLRAAVCAQLLFCCCRGAFGLSFAAQNHPAVTLGEDIAYITGKFIAVYRRDASCSPRMRLSKPDQGVQAITSLCTSPDHSRVAAIERHETSQRISFWDKNMTVAQPPICADAKAWSCKQLPRCVCKNLPNWQLSLAANW